MSVLIILGRTDGSQFQETPMKSADTTCKREFLGAYICVRLSCIRKNLTRKIILTAIIIAYREVIFEFVKFLHVNILITDVHCKFIKMCSNKTNLFYDITCMSYCIRHNTHYPGGRGEGRGPEEGSLHVLQLTSSLNVIHLIRFLPNFAIMIFTRWDQNLYSASG